MQWGFLRTRSMARYWRGRLQIDVTRDGSWVIAWNGWKRGFIFAGDRNAIVMVEATRYERMASLALMHRGWGKRLIARLDG